MPNLQKNAILGRKKKFVFISLDEILVFISLGNQYLTDIYVIIMIYFWRRVSFFKYSIILFMKYSSQKVYFDSLY